MALQLHVEFLNFNFYTLFSYYTVLRRTYVLTGSIVAAAVVFSMRHAETNRGVSFYGP